jgi:TolB protein
MLNALSRIAAPGCALLFVVMIWAGCAANRSAPPVVGLTAPADANDRAVVALQSAGVTPAGPLAWAGGASEWRTPGNYRVFFAATRPEGDSDIFAVDLRVNADGAVASGVRPHRVTDTPSGDEQPPVVSGGWLAYATRVEDRYQSVTAAALADLDRRLVFVFEQPAQEVALGWRGSAGASRLVVTARGPRESSESVIDLATAAVEPPGSGLTYIPAVRGEQAWLPNLVSRVRELPFVGPEKIAFLENLFFTLVDEVERVAYRIAGSPPTAPARDEAVHAEADGANAGAESGATETPAPASATGAPPVATDVPIKTPADTAPPTASAVTPLATRPDPGPTATSTAAPSPTPAGVSLADGIRRLSKVRPDSQRPYAEAEVIELDPRLLQIKMIPGTIEPQPTTGLIGAGVIPQEDWGSLVAGFNGGFAAMHGKFGMMVDRKVYLPARDGIATLAVYQDGSLRMGTWGTDLKQTPDMVSYRQNCPPLIENGTITAETGKLTLWGLSVANEVYLYRSGLGLTADGRLIYVVGKPLSAYTLARALQEAGAIYAMQLDVDEFHVAFITYSVKPGKPGGLPAVEGKKLRDDMRGFDGLFLRPFQLDFFYLTRRLQPLAQPVRTAATAAATATPPGKPGDAQAIPHLPGRLAFATNRDGNWEIYAMPAGQPVAGRRLTDHQADDLHPAWSPDGAQLAFTSRRDGDAELYTLRLADGALNRVTRRSSEEWAAAWSPDGARLAYQSDRHGQSDIFVARPDGSGETRLTQPGGNNEAPHWSPDGRRIVFDSDFDVDEAVHASINVYLMNADGSAARRFYPHAESPAWSPDGKTIALNVLRGGRWQIATLNLDGAGYRQLTTGAYDARYPAWSPDGRWLAFAANEAGRWDIYVVPAGGGPPIALTRGAGDNTHPAWGP